MAKFRILAGVHIQNGREFKQGDIVESSTDLTKAFRLKFEAVHDGDRLSTGRQFDVGGGVPTGAEVKVGEDETSAPASKPKGKEVTENFAKAVEQDFAVFKSGGQYFVYDKDDVSKPINADGCNKADVDGVIAKALKAQR